MMADSNAGASRHTLGVNTAPRALSGFLHHRPIRSLHYTFEHPRPATGSNYCLLMAASSSVCLKYPNGHSRDVGGTTHAPIERNKRQQARRFYFV